MIAYLVLGLFVGYVVCAVNRIYSVREFLGFSFLALVGALEGKILASFLSGELGFESQMISALAIVSGAMILALVKLALFYTFKDRTRMSV